MLSLDILVQSVRPLHLAMSADQSSSSGKWYGPGEERWCNKKESQFNAGAREFVPAGPPGSKAKAKAAWKAKAKAAKTKDERYVDSFTAADRANMGMTEDGIAVDLDNSDDDGFTHLVPGGMLEKDIIEVIGSERMAKIKELQKRQYVEKSGKDKDTSSTAPGNVSFAPAGSADRKGKGKATNKGKGEKTGPETVGSSSDGRSGPNPGASSGHKDSRWREDQQKPKTP